ncbi:MAG: hypothetical protein D4R65_08855 [Verrucomicrobiaceae bacterium]|nr:MAG: hypothetical protein D4R65_08855 [Verrucomicrobiaceae bacterium]
MSAKPTPFEQAHYGKLVGRKILGIQWEDLEGRPLLVLGLSGKDSKGRPATAAVMCDPEGNGPGHLEHSL